MGDFDYEKFDIKDEGMRVSPPLLMENSTVYVGQFKDDVKHGRGKLMWTDGSVYEASLPTICKTEEAG